MSPDENAVRVSSLHGAKGHEFGTVFVVGAVEGVIPLGSEIDTQTTSSEAAVLYVGMTRARDLLYLSHSGIGGHGKSPVTLFFYRSDCQMVRLRGIQALTPEEFTSEHLRFCVLPME